MTIGTLRSLIRSLPYAQTLERCPSLLHALRLWKCNLVQTNYSQFRRGYSHCINLYSSALCNLQRRLLVAERTPASVEASVPATPQSARGGVLSRLCPCCYKFCSCLKKMDCRKCLARKSTAGSRVGILDGSKAGMIGGSKASVEEGSRSGPLLPEAGKCGWLRKIFCSCSRNGKGCSCCRKAGSELADDSRRRSNATSRMSKKQSRSSSTAVEVSVTR